MSTEDQILHLFDSKVMESRESLIHKDALPWDTFAKALMNICKETSNKVAKLQPLLGNTNYIIILLAPKSPFIPKQNWVEFIKWFSPLVVVNDYQSLYGTDDTQEPANGYTLPEVVDIVAPRYIIRK